MFIINVASLYCTPSETNVIFYVKYFNKIFMLLIL